MIATPDNRLGGRIAELYIPSRLPLVEPEESQKLDERIAAARAHLDRYISRGGWSGAWDTEQ